MNRTIFLSVAFKFFFFKFFFFNLFGIWDLSFASAVVVIHLAVGRPIFFFSDLCSFTYSISDDQRAATDPIDFILFTQFGSCVDLATM